LIAAPHKIIAVALLTPAAAISIRVLGVASVKDKPEALE
jgi:hypothetical protein